MLINIINLIKNKVDSLIGFAVKANFFTPISFSDVQHLIIEASKTGTIVELSNVILTKISIAYFGNDSPHNMELYFNNQLVIENAAFPLSDLSGEISVNCPISVDSFKIVNNKSGMRGRIVIEYIP